MVAWESVSCCGLVCEKKRMGQINKGSSDKKKMGSDLYLYLIIIARVFARERIRVRRD